MAEPPIVPIIATPVPLQDTLSTPALTVAGVPHTLQLFTVTIADPETDPAQLASTKEIPV